jgi:imidazolonepropionase-like amidohydrolase
VIGSWLIGDEDDARNYVRQWKEWGVPLVKIYTWEEYALPWPLQRVVVEEARRVGIPVVGHGTDIEEITKSVTLGFSMLEHTPSPPPYDDVLTMLAEAGTRWDPTLAMYGGNSLLLRDEPERLADPKLRAFIPPWQIRDAQAGGLWWSLGDAELRGQWAQELASIRAAHRKGVKLQIGTDSGSRLLGGPSIGWELEYFVQAGLTPLEAIRIATQEAAVALGVEADLGTLQLGKLADIVLLDANPLEDVRNTQTIWRVIKGGWVFDPEKLRPTTGLASE